MGRIRISLFRDTTIKHNHDVVEPLAPKEVQLHELSDDDKALELEGLPSYPTQPKTAKLEQLPFIAAEDVLKRDGTHGSDFWIVVDNVVLDVTEYMYQHPGGSSIIRGFAGQDCSWQWYETRNFKPTCCLKQVTDLNPSVCRWTFHHGKIWTSEAASLRVGRTTSVENKHKRPPQIVGLRTHAFIDE